MAELQYYEIASRRHKSVVAIPWAEPAPPVSVPYPSYLEPKQFYRASHREAASLLPLDDYPATPGQPLTAFLSPQLFVRSESRGALDLPELNERPATPPGFQSGFYPGSGPALSMRYSFSVDLQALPALDTFAATPAPEQPLPAYIEPPLFIRQEKRSRLDLLELNERPATPPGFQSGFYPGSAAVIAIHSEYSVSLQFLPSLDTFAATPAPEQPMTAFLEPPIFVRKNVRGSLHLPPLDNYAVTPAPPAALKWTVQPNDSSLWVVQPNDS